METIIVGAVAIIIGFFLATVAMKILGKGKIDSAEERAKLIVENAQSEAQTAKKEAIVEGKGEVQKYADQSRSELSREEKEKKIQWAQTEKRLNKKEEALERKIQSLEDKENNLLESEKKTEELQEVLKKTKSELSNKLENIAQLSKEEAKEVLFENVREEMKIETAQLIKEIKEKAKEDADKEAKEIIVRSIQRCASDHIAEATVYVVSLPNDEMKGRIIGREGRNIRSIEQLTGVDLIIDDTPEAVVLSGFDPVRREIARITLEKLIADGRIHPAKIEEAYEKATKEVEKIMKESGEEAVLETGITRIHPELVKLIGRLKYRTSYGQNILKHSIEVAHLAANLANELGADVQKCRRAGLLHDLGKGIDQDVDGTHIELGVQLLKKYKENPDIIHAVEAHHGDVEATTMEAVIVQVADALSAARPGARRETLDTYVKRLQKLEEIADNFEGVEKSYAIQAGRELRVIIKPEKIDDLQSVTMSRDIAKEIESTMEYPGQIKVLVIRETRVTEYAK